MALLAVPLRPSRVLVIGILTVAFILLLRHNLYQVPTHRVYDDVAPQFTKSVIPPQTHPEDVVTEGAHRFTSPDDFLGDHLTRVRKLPPLAVSEAKKTCTWTPEQLSTMQFMWGPESTWMQAEVSINETEDLRREWFNHLEHWTVPWPSVQHLFKGRGIVTTAGHINSLKRLAVSIKQLARLKSTLPVEVGYWGDEISDKQKAWLESLYPHMLWNDLSARSANNVFRTHSPNETKYGHFHIKTAAILNSRFAEILLLDSDNTPVTLPETLFETAVYREYGTIFWPDMARTRAENPMWAITNTRCRMDEYEQESGQMLVDKRKFWYHLQMAAWMNENGNYLMMLLGDKDMFRFSWHMLKTQFGRPNQWLTSVGMAHDGRYCGHTYAQRHPDGPIAFLHRGLYKLHNKATLKWFKEHGGMNAHFKQAPQDTDASYPIRSQWAFDNIEGIPGGKVWSCMDLPEVQQRPMDELIPHWEQTWTDIDGYWMIDDPEEE